MLAVQANKMPGPINGGRFDFDDGGTYCGGWEDGKAHGHGVCTGPKGQGEYSGSWHFGFEVSGIYTWPSGATYEGQWQNGKRHGLGVETRGRWSYKGEWTQGYKGRYGVRLSLTSNAKYEGTWASGLQDGYGSETYADGGTYQGQWMRGMRHGYGIRTSAPYGLASHSKPKLADQNVPREAESQGTGAGGGNVSTGSGGDPASDRDKKMDDGRGGFVLKARSDEAPKERRRGSLIEKSTTMKRSIFQRLRKQRSTGDLDKKGTGSLKSAPSTTSWASTDSAASGMHPDGCEMDSNASFVTQDEQVDPQVTETYMGEWKNDKRSGFGISERTDGLKYEGEWFNNKKYGYGVTTFKDGTKEEGKYKNNILITSHKKKHMFLIRSAKFRERIEQALAAAARASKIALQKADIAVSRTAMARGKADQADIAAMHAREDADLARVCAKQFAPDFRPYGSDMPKMQQKGASGPSGGQPPQLEVTSPSGHVERTNQDHYPHHQPETSVHSSMTPMTPEMNLSPFSPHSTAQEPTHSPYDAHILGSVPNHTQQIPEIQQNSMYQTNFNQDQFSRPDFELGGSRLNQAPNMGFSPQSFGLQGPVPGMSMQQQQQQQQQYPPTSSAYHPQNKPMNMYGNEAGMMQDQSMGQNWMPERDQVLQQLQMQLQQQQQQQQQHQQHHQQHHHVFGPSTRNRPTRGGSVDPNELMNERFSHYDRRAPSRDRSRDSSVDRFSHRSTSRYSSRQNLPGSTPVSNPANPFGRGNVGTLPSRIGDVGNSTGLNRANSPPANPSFTNQRSAQFGGNESPFDSPVINLDASLGYSVPSDRSDMAPSPTPSGGPKRTESLYITPVTKPKEPSAAAGLGISSSSGSGTVRKRKKSLPTTEKIGVEAGQLMSREEVAHLSHYRRQEIHRELEESARYRANPLLYLCSPNVRDWFSKQQLVLVVLIINISLAYLFFHLLT